MTKQLIRIAPLAAKLALVAACIWVAVRAVQWFHYGWLAPAKVIVAIVFAVIAQTIIRRFRSTEHGDMGLYDREHRFAARPIETPTGIVWMLRLPAVMSAVSAVFGLVREWQIYPWWFALLSTLTSLVIIASVVYVMVGFRPIGVSTTADDQDRAFRTVAGWPFYQPIVHMFARREEV